MRSRPPIYTRFSLRAPARKRPIVKLGSSANPALAAACASSILPKYANAAASDRCVNAKLRLASIARRNHITASASCAVQFATDSPVERKRFELPVPRSQDALFGSPYCWITTAQAEPWAALRPLQQCAHVRDRVGIAFQAVRILVGLQFNLQPDAVRIVEVEGLAIPPFDNVGHGDAMVLEPLVGGVKFLRRVHR